MDDSMRDTFRSSEQHDCSNLCTSLARLSACHCVQGTRGDGRRGNAKCKILTIGRQTHQQRRGARGGEEKSVVASSCCC